MKNYYDERLLLLQASNILPLFEKKIPTSCPMWHVKMGTQAVRPDADEGQSNWEEWFQSVQTQYIIDHRMIVKYKRMGAVSRVCRQAKSRTADIDTKQWIARRVIKGQTTNIYPQILGLEYFEYLPLAPTKFLPMTSDRAY
jgi:hypothetical protein